MGLFSKPEVIILKESNDAREYLTQLEELSKKANILFLVLFLILLGIPGLIQWKEEKTWNSYDLKG